MRKISTFLLLLMTGVASAQWSETIDTVTTGDFDDINPQVDHAGLNAFPISGVYGFKYLGEWMVFERWTGDGDAIAAVKFSGTNLKWDSNAVTISPAEAGAVMKYPDVCTAKNGTSIAAWQESSDSAWNIYYSICNIDSGNWSSPVALTNDSVNNTHVGVRTISDTSFVVSWRRKSSILFSVYSSGSFSPADTLVQTSTDSTEYDLAANRLVWTEKSASGNRFCLVSTVESFTSPALSPADTVKCPGDMSNPRFMEHPGWPPQTFTFNLFSGGRYSAWWSSYPMVTGYTPEELAGDTVSSCLHPVCYAPTYIVLVKSRLEKTAALTSMYFYAWEKQTGADTSVIFYNAGMDSVQKGRNPSVSFLSFPVDSKTSLGFVAWQSDRSGRSHIYVRNFLWIQTDIDGPINYPGTYILRQNYPNPFNPTTNIEFRIANFGFVSLKVYDVLGRLVATLVNGERSPGSYEVQFNGSKLASGVYFCRLTAPGVNIVRKMLLEK